MHGTLPSPWASSGARYRAHAAATLAAYRADAAQAARRTALRGCFDVTLRKAVGRLAGDLIAREVMRAAVPMFGTLDRIVRDVAAIGHYADFPHWEGR